jgi:hypothetical protein
MITKSFSIPSPSCVHSIVREMTPDEIRQMNELLAARRKWFIAQINQHNVNARLDAIAAAFVWATAEEREALKEIPLSQGKVALVDEADYEYLSQWKWYANKSRHTWYARRNEGKYPFRKTIRMHRAIVNASDNELVDHRDGNGLNNSRKNIRVCSLAENNRNCRLRKDNTTGFKGVYKSGKKWQSYIRYQGDMICLGTFLTPEEAARTYDAKARELFGDFAKTNYELLTLDPDNDDLPIPF